MSGAVQSAAAFNALNDSADPDSVMEWQEQERMAQAERSEDPTAMDIYDVKLEKGLSTPAPSQCNYMLIKGMINAAPTRKQRELEILATQTRVTPSALRGAATWLASGINIEESQITLARDVATLAANPNDNQKLKVAHLRESLQSLIDVFVEEAVKFLGDGFDSTEILNRPNPSVDHHTDDEEGSDNDVPYSPPLDAAFRPEVAMIPLPSYLGAARCKALGISSLVEQEVLLREGQANDALHAIRVGLADKAVIFRNTVRSSKTQSGTTRAWNQVNAVSKAVALNAKKYSVCRTQLSKLGADQLLEKFLPLKKGDLKASSAVADPSARGQRNSTLPWFWSLNVQGDSSNSDWMTECELPLQTLCCCLLHFLSFVVYRVHWLRTKSQRDRWEEELILVQHEMDWTYNFFIFKSKQWDTRYQKAKAGNQDGHACYAARQAHVYSTLAGHAIDSFKKIKCHAATG